MRRLGTPMGSKPRRYLLARLAHYGIDTSHFCEEPLPPRAPRSFAKEILADAAARSTSIRDMFVHMGIPPQDGPYGHVRRKLDTFGIDTSHFTSGRARTGEHLYPQAEFTRAVASSRTLAAVLRKLGEPRVNGSTFAKAKRSIDAYGLSTEHFTGQGHLVGTVSPRRKGAQAILVRQAPGSRRTPTSLLRRALCDIGTPAVCAACGLGELWRGKRLVLEIDHVNGDRADNRPENLRYLCPSCHSQTRTFSNRRPFAQ
ncbi:HNH endonuclease [Streptomyces sp. NPDC006552]|uniref:HNH endonuclease signature motif containing protein n=1 Tax=Streptomyces sp. NPDC006552 TaxID=3157179 RepID=UPI0033BBD27F